MKQYIIISGFNPHDNNRGTAALSYGSINFCISHGYLKYGQKLLTVRPVLKFWKYHNYTNSYNIDGKIIYEDVRFYPFFEKIIFEKIGILPKFSKINQFMKEVSMVVAINGGDGFSDLYGKKTFYGRLFESKLAIKLQLPLILLPQTLGPINEPENQVIANRILTYASIIYIRDTEFVDYLSALHLNYTIEKDLSYYMAPEPFPIEICENAIGINVSGLCYFNNFRTLKGRFSKYPILIHKLIDHFVFKGYTIYLIPHSYCFNNADVANDDRLACISIFKNLKSKENVIPIDADLTSPQLKYLISKMKFFIGTRMHANFAAVFTGVPVFGLAYSYKFIGAFNANNLDGKNQTENIIDITDEDIKKIITKIDIFFNSSI